MVILLCRKSDSRFNQVIKLTLPQVTSPAMGQRDIVCLLIQCAEKDMTFLPWYSCQKCMTRI